MSDGGKGDAMRPTDRAAFNAGIERTFGVKKPWYVRRDELQPAPQQQEPAAWPIRGVRVDGDTVIITVKGGNDAARWLCGEILATKERAAPAFDQFMQWANAAGYDTAHAHDGMKWVCLNPMTADLWKAWQAAKGMK